MNPLVFHLVSGDAFFTGHALLILALLLRLRSNKASGFEVSPETDTAASLSVSGGDRLALRHAVGNIRGVALSLMLGMFLIAGTAIPTSAINYMLWGAIAISWHFTEGQLHAGTSTRPLGVFVFVLLVSSSMFVELTYRAKPAFVQNVSSTVTVLGDSVSAGIGEGGIETWPQILSREFPVSVVDYSAMGATIGSELQKLQNRVIPAGLVIVELGGNDVLGDTSVSQFRRDLDEFLTILVTQSDAVVMFELSVPPFYNRFGSVQRCLARKHGVQLISRRIFADVLRERSSTLDTIHLSTDGHRRMAQSVWSQIHSAF